MTTNKSIPLSRAAGWKDSQGKPGQRPVRSSHKLRIQTMKSVSAMTCTAPDSYPISA